jgi:hypothetical protein
VTPSHAERPSQVPAMVQEMAFKSGRGEETGLLGLYDRLMRATATYVESSTAGA